MVAPNRDPAQSVEDAKRHVASYASIAQYEGYFAAHGFGAEARRLQAAATERADRAALVPDEMARTFVVCGTPDEVRAQIDGLWEFCRLHLPATPAGAPSRAAGVRGDDRGDLLLLTTSTRLEGDHGPNDLTLLHRQEGGVDIRETDMSRHHTSYVEPAGLGQGY